MSNQVQQLDVTFDDTSPLVRYIPGGKANDSSNGWLAVCDAPLWRCDEHSAHQTGMDAAGFAFSFWGNSVTLYGNVTLGMNISLTLDGNTQSVTPGGGSDGQILAELVNLNAGQHTVSVTTSRWASPSTLSFDKAVVGIGNATSVNKILVSGVDTQTITYGPSNNNTWALYQDYAGTVVPDGVNNKSFEASNRQGATFSYQFTGSALFYYGPCYQDTAAYTVQLDGTPNSQPQVYNASVPYLEVIESCLRFHAAGLDTNVSHELLVTNADPNWLTVDWLEVWDYTLVGSGTSSSDATLRVEGSSFTFFALLCLVLFHML